MRLAVLDHAPTSSVVYGFDGRLRRSSARAVEHVDGGYAAQLGLVQDVERPLAGLAARGHGSVDAAEVATRRGCRP